MYLQGLVQYSATEGFMTPFVRTPHTLSVAYKAAVIAVTAIGGCLVLLSLALALLAWKQQSGPEGAARSGRHFYSALQAEHDRKQTGYMHSQLQHFAFMTPPIHINNKTFRHWNANEIRVLCRCSSWLREHGVHAEHSFGPAVSVRCPAGGAGMLAGHRQARPSLISLHGACRGSQPCKPLALRSD